MNPDNPFLDAALDQLADVDYDEVSLKHLIGVAQVVETQRLADATERMAAIWERCVELAEATAKKRNVI